MGEPSATPHRKFGFDTEFFELIGTPKQGANMPAVPNAPLPRGPEALRQQAYTEGHTAGLAEGQAQAQADLARLQQHLQNTLISLQNTLEEREAQTLSHMLGFMQRTLTHLVGHAAQHYGAEVLEHHLRQLLPLSRADEALTLRVPPQAVGYHEKLGLPQATIMGVPLRVITDNTLGPVDALIEWNHGGVEARLTEHTAQLEALLQAAGASALPPAPLNLAATPTPAGAAPSTAPATPMPAAEPTLNDAIATAAQARAKLADALLGDDELLDALK